ncbi:MAG: PspC domain-containing protein [Patescibacteria group bacterium]
MKKVINITIGSMVFNVEDDAFEKLSTYLDSIKKYFSKDKDGDEIVEDLEASIAEKFSKRKNKDGAVTEKDVDGIIEQIGTLKDFKKMSEEEDDDEVPDEPKEAGEKKLYRDPDDAIIAGVCSGLGAYFGIETVLVRLIFFITILFGGFGIVIYVILWLIMPVAETTAQKAEMRGERLTLHEIEKSVKKGVENLKKKDLSGVKDAGAKGKLLLTQFFQVLGKIFHALLNVLRILLGIVFAVGGILGAGALSFALTWQLSGGVIPDTTYTLKDFIVATDFMYIVFIVSVYLIVLLPLLLLFFIGLSFLKNRSILSTNAIIFFTVLWFAATGIAGSVVSQNQGLIEQRFEEIDQAQQERYESGTESLEVGVILTRE